MRSVLRPVSTFSIVARDVETGQLGVAVQSHWFSVGTVVPWAESGVGVVATQSVADPAYGPIGLSLMRSGKRPGDALAALLASDESSEVRQVSLMDAHGRVATHTGSGCIAEAGHLIGEQFSVQANLVADNSVWRAMAEAYSAGVGDFVDRILDALDAAQAEGGDIRGKQSAALLVVAGESTGQPWNDRLFDLRVEDHLQPLAEMRRLVSLRRAYMRMNAGDDAMAHDDPVAALAEYDKALELAPDVVEVRFWKAVMLAAGGQVDQSIPVFEGVFLGEPAWREVLQRVLSAGLVDIDDGALSRILD